MLSGLKEGQEKMSKSDPMSAIFMEDSEEDVRDKIKKAFCPEKIATGNPCLEYIKYIVFGSLGEILIERKAEYGGNKFITILYPISKFIGTTRSTKILRRTLLKAAFTPVI